MIFILIPVAWLAVTALVVAVCRAASRGDTEPALVIEATAHPLRPGLVVWEQASGTARSRRQFRRPEPRHGARTRSQRLSAHGIR
jgi:hypothetical protein